MIRRIIAWAAGLALLATSASAHSPEHHSGANHPTPELTDPAANRGDTEPFPVAIGGPFLLSDAGGRAIDSRRDFAGRLVLVFFGYARCPGLCPTALTAMEEALDLLPKEAAGKVQPVLITIDPVHDTKAVLRTQLARDHPRIMGLTGSEAEIQAARDAFNVRSVLVHTTDKGVPIYAHGSWIYLLDGGGKLSALLPPTATAEDIALVVGRRL